MAEQTVTRAIGFASAAILGASFFASAATGPIERVHETSARSTYAHMTVIEPDADLDRFGTDHWALLDETEPGPAIPSYRITAALREMLPDGPVAAIRRGQELVLVSRTPRTGDEARIIPLNDSSAPHLVTLTAATARRLLTHIDAGDVGGAYALLQNKFDGASSESKAGSMVEVPGRVREPRLLSLMRVWQPEDARRYESTLRLRSMIETFSADARNPRRARGKILDFLQSALNLAIRTPGFKSLGSKDRRDLGLASFQRAWNEGRFVGLALESERGDDFRAGLSNWLFDYAPEQWFLDEPGVDSTPTAPPSSTGTPRWKRWAAKLGLGSILGLSFSLPALAQGAGAAANAAGGLGDFFAIALAFIGAGVLILIAEFGSMLTGTRPLSASPGSDRFAEVLEEILHPGSAPGRGLSRILATFGEEGDKLLVENDNVEAVFGANTIERLIKHSIETALDRTASSPGFNELSPAHQRQRWIWNFWQAWSEAPSTLPVANEWIGKDWPLVHRMLLESPQGKIFLRRLADWVDRYEVLDRWGPQRVDPSYTQPGSL